MKEVNEIEFKNEASSGLVIADFSASWCSPCRALTPILETISSKNPDVKFIKVDIEANQKLSEDFQISSIPSLVFLKNGREVDRLFGYIDKEGVEMKLKSLI
jgi:thioredoxin 1